MRRRQRQVLAVLVILTVCSAIAYHVLAQQAATAADGDKGMSVSAILGLVSSLVALGGTGIGWLTAAVVWRTKVTVRLDAVEGRMTCMEERCEKQQTKVGTALTELSVAQQQTALLLARMDERSQAMDARQAEILGKLDFLYQDRADFLHRRGTE